MNNNLLLIGGGGHCKSIIDSLLDKNDYSKIAVIDMPEKIGTNILGIPVIGNDNDIKDLYNLEYTYGFVSIGTIGNTDLKVKLYNKIKNIGFTVPNIFDVTSTINKYSELGDGIYAGKKSVVNADVKIGSGVIINTGAIIEHDCEISDFCHIAPGAVLCGNVKIGRNTHIGAGTVVKQGVTIGANAMIGIGSVVTKDIASGTTAYGNPCREKT